VAGGQAKADMAISGACLCGSVRFTVRGPLREVLICHCSQCRKMSGHYWASTSAHRDCVEIREDGSLRWYQSSSKAKRGFCGHCGSSLFWSHAEKDSLSIAAGALDMPTGLATGAHIFFDDASDYYRVHPDEATLDGSSF
ncbi:MAG: GFA family protein, partial [Arenicellales bacterium]